MKNFTPRVTLFALLACMLFSASGVSAATILSETFGTSLGDFTTQSLAGDTTWFWTTYSGSSYAKITGYYSSTNHENDDWLISPSMDFSDITKANLSFMHAHKYGVDLTKSLTLMVSDSYTGGTIDTTKWVSIDFVHSDGTSWTFVSSGLLSLDAYAGKENVRFAFRYKSSSTAGATWEVNNVLVESVTEEQATVILTENFDKMTKGTKANPGSVDYSLNDSLNTYMNTTGWTGSKVYSAAGAIKLGTSGGLGYLTTPAVNLSSNGGTFLVSFKARAWKNDSTAIQIYVNDVMTKRVDGISNADTPYVLTSYGPIEVTGGTSSTYVKFSGLQASKGRFFLDSIVIAQVIKEVNTPVVSLTTATFKTESGTSITKDLTLTASNLTGDLSILVTDSSAATDVDAFTTTVSSVTAAEAMDSLGFTLPITYAPTVAGNDTAYVVISGGGLEAPVSVTVTGTAWEAVSVASLAALREAYDAAPSDETTIYRVTGEVFATFTHTSGNSKYLQDSTGGVLVYDYNKIITSTINRGDGLTGLIGTMDTYGGVMELIPVADVAASSTGNTIEPVVLTVPEYKADRNKYESMLIQIDSLTNLTTNTTWSTSRANYNFANGTDTVVIRTNYSGLDYMGKAILTGAVNYRGVALEYNGTAQLCPRDSNDINVATVNAITNPIIRNTVYGSKGILSVVATQGQRIEVYNILGRKVLNAVANEGTNTYTLPENQLYLVRSGRTTSKIVL